MRRNCIYKVMQRVLKFRWCFGFEICYFPILDAVLYRTTPRAENSSHQNAMQVSASQKRTATDYVRWTIKQIAQHWPWFFQAMHGKSVLLRQQEHHGSPNVGPVLPQYLLQSPRSEGIAQMPRPGNWEMLQDAAYDLCGASSPWSIRLVKKPLQGFASSSGLRSSTEASAVTRLGLNWLNLDVYGKSGVELAVSDKTLWIYVAKIRVTEVVQWKTQAI